jgi:hypothetical protein
MRDARQRPWLRPYADVLAALGDPVDLVGEGPPGHVAARLDAIARQVRCPVRFVAPPVQPLRAVDYERQISQTGTVPTRDNLHDLFNGLVWLRFPAFKHWLHRAHAAEIARQEHLPAAADRRRGPLRDALTLLDENGALLGAPAALMQALRRRDWQRLFIVERAAWHEATLVVVGHALLEKLQREPRPALTAHVWLADDATAELVDKPFVPMPVLGVPGWWNPNEDPTFYADAAVFRPARNASGDSCSGKALVGEGL